QSRRADVRAVGEAVEPRRWLAQDACLGRCSAVLVYELERFGVDRLDLGYAGRSGPIRQETRSGGCYNHQRPKDDPELTHAGRSLPGHLPWPSWFGAAFAERSSTLKTTSTGPAF